MLKTQTLTLIPEVKSQNSVKKKSSAPFHQVLSQQLVVHCRFRKSCLDLESGPICLTWIGSWKEHSSEDLVKGAMLLIQTFTALVPADKPQREKLLDRELDSKPEVSLLQL